MYYVTPLDNAGAVDFGGSASETTAARIALRVANRERQSMAVVNEQGITTQKVLFLDDGLLQRLDPVTNKPLPRLPEDDALPVEDKGPHYFTGYVMDAETLQFIMQWIAKGFVVTVSPKRGGGPAQVNLVARK